jgi:glycosyltransferase involved in cell wall biosynthesis
LAPEHQGDRVRVLELRSVRGTGGGPEKTILLGTARTNPNRFDVTVCYIRDLRDDVFAIDEWARCVGVPYVEVRERHSFDPRIWRALRELVKQRRVDVVHAHDYKTNLIALALGRAEGLIPLSTVHGWTGQSWRERWIYYPADKRVLRRFPHLIAVSEQIRRDLVHAGAPPERVTTILNAIDPDAFRRTRSDEADARAAIGLPSDALVIGGVGRLEPQKRFDVLIDVFAHLKAASSRWHLVIAGDGSLRAGLAAQVHALQLESHIHLLGHRTDISRLHHAFDLFVQSSDYEGTPNAVLEAMALETPVVATDVGGTREIAHDQVHALIVPPRDPTSLAQAIARLIADRSLGDALAGAARRRVETELSFAARMARVETIYETLMADHGRNRRFTRWHTPPSV